MEMQQWLRDDLSDLREYTLEIREELGRHGERLATIESKLEDIVETRAEKLKIKGGLMASIITAVGALVTALWQQQ
jgi:hypothetical protein